MLKFRNWGIGFVLTMAIAARAQGAAVTPLTTTPLAAAIGQAYRLSNNSIYFVEWASGSLSRVNLATGVVHRIQNGFTNPESLAILPGTGTAFVTTRDGKVWRASLTGPAKAVAASGLGMPHAIVLDPAMLTGYVTDFAGGNLWKVPLAGGGPTAVVTGLTNPLGLLMSPDFKTAYVQEPNRLLKIDLATHSKTVLATGFVDGFFMDWANDAHSAIYVTERDPANSVSIVNLGTSPATKHLIANVPTRPSSVVRGVDPNVIYVASDSVISKVTLSSESDRGPLITRLGFIPSTNVSAANGLATTDPAYFYYVKNAAFGSTVHVMLNFPRMRALGAHFYKVIQDADPDTSPQKVSWNNYKWNGSTFVLDSILPNPAGFYSVPLASDLFAIPDLGFSWDTTPLTNFRHTLHVKLYDAASNPIIGSTDTISPMIDNTAPVMFLNEIRHDGVPINECALITSGSPNLSFTFTAFEAQGHLYNYALTDNWGHGHSATITADQYIGSHDTLPNWTGVNPAVVNYTVTNTSCAHQFYLGGWANTTNGYGLIHYSSDFNTVAIYLGGNCQPIPVPIPLPRVPLPPVPLPVPLPE